MNEALLQVSGSIRLGLAASHVMFWQLFRWPRELAELPQVNRAVMQVPNPCLTVVFLLFASGSLRHLPSGWPCRSAERSQLAWS